MATLVPFAKRGDVQALAPTLSDAAADLALELVSAGIRDSLHWDVDQVVGATYTQIVQRGTAPLVAVVLPALNVTAIASVEIDGVVQDVSTYDCTPGGVLYLHSVTVSEKVVVTYTAGYVRAPEDKAPGILRLVAIEYAIRLGTNPDGTVSYAMGGTSETLGAGAKALADEDSRLDVHRAVTL
jgi:hypothetical protein